MIRAAAASTAAATAPERPGEKAAITQAMDETKASLSAINAVVSTGLAVTAQLQSLLPADLRIIGEAENLPQLPSASIVLLRKHNSAASPIIECFAEYIVEGFKL